jgi:phenylacetate-coenzyme A ligase PaaK-like adenylate-forming protein
MPAASMTSPTVSSIRALAAELIARERWSRGRLADHQRQALTSLVRHAATASPYYRDQLARWSKGGDVMLADLPVLTHATLMSAYDGIVCDPRVRLADLERHVASANPAALHLGGYRVFVTGGTSGSRGLFLYSRAEWTLVPANYVRWITALGLGPGTRLATIGPSNPLHLANRAFADLGTPEPSAVAGAAGMSGASGARSAEATALRLTVTVAIDDIVKALNHYQPDIMVMPPSAASRLADEQAAGRLTIRPRVILSSAEVLTDAARARFRAAWGADLYDTYVMTETGLIGAECPQRGGIHISEDLVVLESVDEHHQPVPHGTAGAKVLITNLTNYAQPLIRYEVPDRITISQDICRCGRPFASISRIDPRIATDTPTMALGELPTMVGHVGNPPLRLVKSPRRDA